MLNRVTMIAKTMKKIIMLTVKGIERKKQVFKSSKEPMLFKQAKN